MRKGAKNIKIREGKKLKKPKEKRTLERIQAVKCVRGLSEMIYSKEGKNGRIFPPKTKNPRWGVVAGLQLGSHLMVAGLVVRFQG